MGTPTTFTLPDGTLIEWAQSRNVNGPDCKTGLNYGTSYLYVRVNGGFWTRPP